MGVVTISWPPPSVAVGGAPLGSPTSTRKKRQGVAPKSTPLAAAAGAATSRSILAPLASCDNVPARQAAGGEQLVPLPDG
ncbi:hypothetical protein Scep_002141 [Stephania cephalantha]|uniref:Uncharacterized protein n=1 Tax=Stephania cephalantha TaxID=152367 RepID=A0AAP0LC38_9MAGN